MNGEQTSTATETGVRVRTHPSLCTGFGNCHRWAPHVYPLDADGRVDIHLLDGRGEPAGCLSRNDEEVSLDAAAGTYHLVIDTYVDGAGAARAGEYLLIVLLE